MARSASPGGYSNYEDDSLFQNAAFTHDISEQMRVPKRIRATGGYFDEHELLSNGNGEINSWNYSDKIEMNVPDRIVVLGQDQHLGTKSAPREIMLENSIMPKDPGCVRVSTPPRVITLSEHHFPSASDEPEATGEKDLDEERNYDDYESRSLNSIDDPNSSVNVGNRQRFGQTGRGAGNGEVQQKRATFSKHNSELVVPRSFREETPTFGGSVENLTPPEEMIHLRRQVAKMNRRLLAIELDNMQRQQREKIIYCVGLAYLLLKTFMWLSRK
ncbi:transport and Golgi organization protein 11 isoform X2 [Toxorhynchites rutilus septentrionalis]|uniref:transport and Golgi organization protein 11 isoform X2 n=1 Tax=Toxorhynchites rutilus septentrionalis TaxID=329112 RepID=UPI00247AD894|nr:transport and Golgi organization protein 11 isoform X2 [Toxorhynchites rutilus septentrionalis]